VGKAVFYVYLIESKAHRRYVGLTTDLKQRLAEHNAGKSPYTSTYRPWRLMTYVAFSLCATPPLVSAREPQIPGRPHFRST
jgi:predicted GIY-YIG superfamily endonuclease